MVENPNTPHELGPEIPINGERPEWLRDDEKIAIQWAHGGPLWSSPTTEAMYVSGWERSIDFICLPADHPYYAVQRYNEEHGTNFTYWPGGDAAPDDWDGGEVLLSDPIGVHPLKENMAWMRESGMYRPVIGYTKRAEPSEETDTDYVRVKRMTEAEWEAADRPFSIVWAKSVGIIREETLLEKFERETGYVRSEAVDAAIEWMERRK